MKTIGWQSTGVAANAACNGVLYHLDGSTFNRVYPTSATLTAPPENLDLVPRWGIGTKLVFAKWVLDEDEYKYPHVWVYDPTGDTWAEYASTTFKKLNSETGNLLAMDQGDGKILFLYQDVTDTDAIYTIEFTVSSTAWGSAVSATLVGSAHTESLYFAGYANPGVDFYLNVGGTVYVKNIGTGAWTDTGVSFTRGYDYLIGGDIDGLLTVASGVVKAPYYWYRYGDSQTQSHDVPTALYINTYCSGARCFFGDGIDIFSILNSVPNTTLKWYPGISAGFFVIQRVGGQVVMPYNHTAYYYVLNLWNTALEAGTCAYIQIATTFNGVAEYDSGKIAYTGTQFTFPLSSFTANGDGNREVTVTVWDEYGDHDSSTATRYFDVTGDGAEPGADTTPPAVVITSPASASTVHGDVTITAYATDNVALGRAEIWIGAIKQEDLTLAGLDDAISYVWPTIDWDNGTYTITVKVWDAANNAATDATVTVVVSNAYADGVRVLYTKLMPIDTTWTPQTFSRLLEGIVWDPLPEDPRRQYAVRVWCLAISNVANDTYDLTKYTRLLDAGKKTHTVPAGTTHVRWAFDTVPMLYQSYFNAAASELVDAVMAADGLAYIVGITPNEVYTFDGVALTKIYDLPAGTPTAVEFFDGEVCVALGTRVHFIDPDAGASTRDYVPNAVLTGATITDIISDGDYLYVATLGSANTEHIVYKFQWKAVTTLPAVTVPADNGGRFVLNGDQVLYATANKIFDATDDMAIVETLTTGDDITQIAARATQVVAGLATGAVEGDLDGAWGSLLALTTTGSGGVAFLWDGTFAADDVAQLYRRDTTGGSFATWKTTDFTKTNRLFEFTFEDASEALVVLGQKSSVGRALLSRLYQPDAAAILSGVNPPNFCGGLAQSQGG